MPFTTSSKSVGECFLPYEVATEEPIHPDEYQSNRWPRVSCLSYLRNDLLIPRITRAP